MDFHLSKSSNPTPPLLPLTPPQEGILTVIVALTAYLFIHNYPSTAPFLTEPERTLIHARLAHDTDATNDEKFAWSNVRAALADYKCWMYGFGFHTMSLPLYTLSLFLPTIIKELGYKAAEAQLLTVPPYAVATILTLLVAVASEKTKKRAPFILASTSLAIIGYIILLTAPRSKPGVSTVQTRYSDGDDDHDWESRCGARHAVVSAKDESAVVSGTWLCVGVFGV
ncbi:putative Uncharacterized transporter [Glarea lozoyensis 74030]|uniref:Putative Uncharacterized transporter n=1 Tax=Glarea lozoyensis (strain ATCC 74030 / MF5533) TaxID=1104152 RepID=H0EP82_GLAL7|nr:putative Uncharacterized transporter [Glarea lozoyensis 74030]